MWPTILADGRNFRMFVVGLWVMIFLLEVESRITDLTRMISPARIFIMPLKRSLGRLRNQRVLVTSLILISTVYSSFSVHLSTLTRRSMSLPFSFAFIFAREVYEEMWTTMLLARYLTAHFLRLLVMLLCTVISSE